MLKSNAILTDWDGRISVLENEEYSLLYRGASSETQEDSVNNQNFIENLPQTNCVSSEMNIQKRRNLLEATSSDIHFPINDRYPNNSVITSEMSTEIRECHDNISRASSARLSSIYQQVAGGSSMLGESITEVMTDDYQNDYESTSTILNYCKRKVLRPYVGILSVVGLNPISTETTKFRACLSYLQCLFLVLVLAFGYFLQYLSAYRGDRGFPTNRKNVGSINESEEGAVYTISELLFGFIIPCLLNFVSYISAVVICKFIDHEQLQNLIERTFLTSMQPKKLHRVIWLHIAAGFIFCCCLHAYFVPTVIFQTPFIQFKWIMELDSKWQSVVKIALLVTLSVQDFIEIIIISSYCIECYLLKVHLLSLSQKLLLHSIDSIDWMREILQFRKLLERLNNNVSLPVSFLVIMNLTYAFAGFIYMFKDFDFQYSAMKTVILNFVNVLLWLVLGLLPFFVAASLTQACQSAKCNGHQIRVRPFVYHNASADDLNSMLIFSSTLDMSAKLFRMPIQSNYICFALLILSIGVITLGMCFNISIFGNLKF